MKIKDVAKMSPIDRFLYWVKERHQIYLRRQKGQEKPWTDDEVLQSYFFTNPYRENDKTTVWFRENIRDPMRDMDEVLFATVCFRWFNWIPTGKELLNHNLLESWNRVQAEQVLQGLKKREGKVFTGAYIVNARQGPKSAPSRTKISVCCERVSAVWEDRLKIIKHFNHCHTLEDGHQFLRQYQGLNGVGFSAYEIVCDLRYTRLLENATDTLTWSNPGSGAKRGLNRLLNRKPQEPLKNWSEQSQQLLKDARQKLKGFPPLEMREIEHSLCEWDKYERARLQDGHMKRKYKGVPECP